MKVQTMLLIIVGLYIFSVLFIRFILPQLILWGLKNKLILLEKNVTKYLAYKKLFDSVKIILSGLDLDENQAETREMILEGANKQLNNANKGTYEEVSRLQEMILEVERLIDFRQKKSLPASYVKELDKLRIRTRELRKEILE